MADYVMFLRSTPHSIVLLILYVDDMVITVSDPVAIGSLKRHLQSEFEIKDLGFLRYFLDIEVAYSSHGYLLSEQKYIADLLERATLSDPATPTSSPVSTPMELHLKLRHDDGTPLPQPTRYRKLVGSLICLSTTRPNISQAVHVLSQFVSAPTLVHYVTLFRVLRYLRSIISRLLLYNSDSFAMSLSDAGWADDLDTRHSTTCFYICLGSSLVSWRNKRQDVVSRSSTEDEYRAVADTTLELW